MKKIYFIFQIIILISFTNSEAQNDYMISNFMNNEQLINPSAAANVNYLEGAIIARQQWVGFGEGAPKTYMMRFSGYIEKISSGIGIIYYSDNLGFENANNFKLNYGFKLKLNTSSSLGIGLAGGIVSKTLHGSELIYQETNDQNGIFNNIKYLKPDFSAGIHYSNKNLNSGICMTHLDKGVSRATIYRVPRHYYLYSRYKIKINEDFSTEPGFIVRSSGYITQFDVNLTTSYKNIIWFGIANRWKESFTALLGIRITKFLNLYYSYDFTTTKSLKNYSNGSHELMILFNLENKEISRRII